MNYNILYGIAPKTHVNLAMDEIMGLRELGHKVHEIQYGQNDQSLSFIKKVKKVVYNARRIAVESKIRKPNFIYLNSRFEKAGCFRDFLTILIIKYLGCKTSKILIKTHGSNLVNDHNAVYEKSNLFFEKIVFYYWVRNVDGALFLSSEEKSVVVENSPIMKNKTFVIPNIINLERVAQEFKYPFVLRADKLKVLFCGRMTMAKGCWDVLYAIPLMKNAKHCQFVFLGDGEELDSLIDMAHTQAYENFDILFPGFIPEDESDPLYRQVDIFVFPTYFTEGFAMALFKAVSVGLPIVTTACRAAKDYLKENENTLWVEEQRPISIAEALDRLFENKSLQQKMRTNNLALGKEFTRQNVCLKISDIMNQIYKTSKS